MTLPRRVLLHGLATLPAGGLLAAALPRPALGMRTMVHDCRGLRAALRAARPGTVVALTPGDYLDDGRGRLVLAVDRVMLRAAGPRHRPVLRVPLLVRGDAARLEGLAFADPPAAAAAALQVRGPERLRISGSGVEVADAEFFGTRGTAVLITGTARDPRVRGCHFHDPLGDPGNPNLNAAIQVGFGLATADTRIGALVEDNRFERWRTEAETVSVKSSGNTVRGNVLVECRNLTNRFGNGNLYEGNTLERSGWVTVFDRGSRLLRNRATSSSGIRVMAGDITPDTPFRNGEKQGHPHADDTFLEGNAGRLIIGYQFSGHRLLAKDTTVASHDGRIELRAQRRTTLP